jgi:hypothetical protein
MKDFGPAKEHRMSDQLRFGMAIEKAAQLPQFTKFMRRIIESEILMKEDQDNFQRITYRVLMPRIRALIQAGQGENVVAKSNTTEAFKFNCSSQGHEV